jgi:hypothetical protein
MRSEAAKRMMERYGSKPKSGGGSGIIGPVLTTAGAAIGAYLGGPAGAQVGAGVGTELGKLTATGEQAEENKDKDGMGAIMKGLEGLADADKKKKLMEMMKAGKISPEQATAAAKGMSA